MPLVARPPPEPLIDRTSLGLLLGRPLVAGPPVWPLVARPPLGPLVARPPPGPVLAVVLAGFGSILFGDLAAWNSKNRNHHYNHYYCH